jgi:cytosine/creatinine deaminase
LPFHFKAIHWPRIKQTQTMDLFFEEAVNQAKKSAKEGGIPIGSVIVHREQILGKGHNQRMQKGSVVLHGEMDALENAGRQEAITYRESTLYTTLSPCPMCTGAILLYGIPKVIIGENKTFMGAEDLLKKNGVEVIVLQDKECIDLMETYIKNHPKEWNEDIGE